MSRVKAARSVCLNDASTRPASMREKSSSEFTSLRKRSPLRCISLNEAMASSGKSPWPMRASIGPSMSVNGVRNSWLTLPKNTFLARSSSASASDRRRSSMCACASASRDDT